MNTKYKTGAIIAASIAFLAIGLVCYREAERKQAAQIRLMRESAEIGRQIDANKAAFIAANPDLTPAQLQYIDRELRRITPQLGREGVIKGYLIFGQIRAGTRGADLQMQLDAFEIACRDTALQMAQKDTPRK